jgi:hypothetical protein
MLDAHETHVEIVQATLAYFAHVVFMAPYMLTITFRLTLERYLETRHRLRPSLPERPKVHRSHDASTDG